MRNSIAAGRRLAARTVLAQAGVSLLVSALFSSQGWSSALAALAGGGLVALGTALLALRMFVGRAPDARYALAAFVAGTVLKWLVVVGGIVLLVGVWRLPMAAVLVGLVAALMVNLLALRFK